jgi:hypothetical protein
LGLEKKKFCCDEHRKKAYLVSKKEKRKSEVVHKACLYCKTEFIPRVKGTRILFCCNEHKRKYHSIKRRKDKSILLEKISLDGLEEKRICYYCTKEYRSTKRKKFCCDAHLLAFKSAVKSNKPISVRINPKLTIKTKKYKSIIKILTKYKKHTEDISLLNSYNGISK